MSNDAQTPDTPAPATTKASGKQLQILLILTAIALLISCINMALLLMNPTASHVEQFNENLKTELADSVATLHKKIDGLRSAEAEWQRVLKKASENPDATYKLVQSPDGMLTLTELPNADSSKP